MNENKQVMKQMGINKAAIYVVDNIKKIQRTLSDPSTNQESTGFSTGCLSIILLSNLLNICDRIFSKSHANLNRKANQDLEEIHLEFTKFIEVMLNYPE